MLAIPPPAADQDQRTQKQDQGRHEPEIKPGNDRVISADIPLREKGQKDAFNNQPAVQPAVRGFSGVHNPPACERGHPRYQNRPIPWIIPLITTCASRSHQDPPPDKQRHQNQQMPFLSGHHPPHPEKTVNQQRQQSIPAHRPKDAQSTPDPGGLIRNRSR